MYTFYIITIQWSEGGRNYISTFTGPVAQSPYPVNEVELYQEVFEKACASSGAPTGRTSVIFYDLR